MNRAIIVTLILLVAVALFVTRAEAETDKHKIISYITKMELVPVPDVENHFIGVSERRGVAIFEDGETATYSNWTSFDSIRGQGGSFSGYSSLGFADGSTRIIKVEGTYTGEKLPSIKGTGEYVKGTGRFDGVKGNASFTGRYITPYTKDETKGDLIIEGTGSATLPKK